jgi:hypothetical protein
MKPSLLKRRFESKHDNLVKKELQYFECLLEDLNVEKTQ